MVSYDISSASGVHPGLLSPETHYPTCDLPLCNLMDAHFLSHLRAIRLAPRRIAGDQISSGCCLPGSSALPFLHLEVTAQTLRQPQSQPPHMFSLKRKASDNLWITMKAGLGVPSLPGQTEIGN